MCTDWLPRLSTNVFNSFCPFCGTVTVLVSSFNCPRSFFEGALYQRSGNAMVHTCFQLFQATTLHSCAAGVLFQLSTKLFWEGLYVRSVVTVRFFRKKNVLKKDLPSFLPRCQKSANACPRLYLLPAIKRQHSAGNLGEIEKARLG